MNTAKRSKRDTAENLYKTCQISGNCQPDVVNKIENKTWADVLLQAFSSIIYLGNLGIGTGKGSVGVRPIPNTRGVPETIAPPTTAGRPTVPSVRQTRPFSVPLDTIGIGSRPIDPLGARPIDILNPDSPAIVPLNETLPDTVITLGEGTIPDLEVVTNTTSINGHPTVLQTPDNEVAILNVTPADPPPTRVIFQTESLNPLFSVESNVGHIDPAYDVFVNPFITSDTITFGEEIPLEPINPRSEFDIEDIPKSSTPADTLNRVYNRARQFYRRRIQQVPTRNVNLLGDVSRAITFGFENPAFDAEVSLQFENDLNTVQAAPDPDFADIERISRPVFSESNNRTIRVSRLGRRSGVRTRSGTVIGQDIHYFYDLSPIQQIELSTFSDSGSTVISLPETVETYLDMTTVGSSHFQNEDLLDTYAETFNNAQLIFPIMDETEETSFIPTVNSSAFVKPFTIDVGKGYFYSSETGKPSNDITPVVPTVPLVPSIAITVNSSDFDIHPSLLLRRKRKRLDSF